MDRAGGQSVALACPAMGTRFELVLRGDDVVALRSAGEAALEEITRWHGLLSVFDKASIVSRLNREAAEHPVPVPPEVAALLRWCAEVSMATGGAFDPAVGHLMRWAGFRGEVRDAVPGRGEAVGCRHIHVDGNRVHFTAPIALDFGAIGKGWALDRAADILREHGITSALLHGGTSSITTIGGPWRIALDGSATIDLNDESLGVSAPSGRTITTASGITHGHILDPRTGRSASTERAVVAGPSAAVCDAWSTALIVDPSLADSAAWPIGYRAVLNEATVSSTPSSRSTLSPQGSPL